MRKLQADFYLTFKINVRYEHAVTNSSERKVQAKTFFFQSWRSLSAVAGLRFAIERKQALFAGDATAEILSVNIVPVKHSINQMSEWIDAEETVFRKVLSWSKTKSPSAEDFLVELEAKAAPISGRSSLNIPSIAS